MNLNQDFRTGIALAALAQGRKPTDVREKAAKLDTLRKDPWYPGEVCKAMGRCYTLAGRGNDLAYHVIDQAVKRADVDPEMLRRIYDDALQAFGAVMEKSAAGGLGTFVGGLFRAGGPAIETVLALAALGGTAAGATSWALERGSKQDKDEVEVTKAKIDAYRQISEEMDEKLRARGLIPASEKKEMVRHMTGADHVYGV